MVLVDTNIIIGFWRKRDKAMEEIFLNEDVAICGVVKAELMHGARNPEDLERIQAALSPFPCLDMHKEDWDELGRNLYRLRFNGITLPFQDVVIATIAMVNDAQVWTNDVHFSRMKTVMPSLKLFCNDEAAE